MFCGTSSFAHVDRDEHGGAGSPSSAPSTPRGSRSRSKKGSSSREAKNPYSSRGLDTFIAVLAELEARRQRIVERVGEKGSMIRFEYSDSQWVPIVVRIPMAAELTEEKKRKRQVKDDKADHQQHDQKRRHERKRSSLSPPRPTSPKSPQPIQSPPVPLTQPKQHQELPAVSTVTPTTPPPPKLEAMRCLSRARCRAAYVGPPCHGLRPLVVLALILICLAASGRTLAICLTCAWWYLAPSPTPACVLENGGGRWWMKNSKTMDYMKRPSGKNLRSGSHVAAGSFASPPKQRVGGFMSPPKQRVSGFMSPPKERLKNFLSPPKSRPAQLTSPAKHRQSFNIRGNSTQLD